MKSMQLELNAWNLKCEIIKLHKLLNTEKNEEKRVQIIEDLVKIKSLINLIPKFNCNSGLNNREYKKDLENYLKREQNNVQNFVNVLKNESDFFMQLAKNYQKLYIKKISDTEFNLTNINYEEIIEIIKYTFNDKFSEFFIKEMESNRYKIVDKKDALSHDKSFKSSNISLRNTRFSNYYVFSKNGSITYYDLYNIINELSHGYVGLYYNINTNYTYFNDLLSDFNKLLIGENINSSKTYNDYLLYNMQILNKLVDNSFKTEKLLEYNWHNDYKIKSYEDYSYNSKNCSALYDLFNNIIAYILFSEYDFDKDVTLGKINYLIKNSKSEDIFKILNEVGITKDDILNTKNIKEHIKKINNKYNVYNEI